jgi:hypothetical protein
MATTTDITAEERNELWDLGEFALSGAFESIAAAKDGKVDYDATVEARQWLGALEVLGLQRASNQGCSIPLTLPLIYFVDAAEKQATEVIEDKSKTLAKAINQMTSDELADRFLPPVEGDTEGGYLIALRHIKAVRERMEAAEPGLRRGAPAPSAGR